MASNSQSNHPLPEDLVRDILSRLSVKMLSRCKLVCKEWCTLIQCPNFVKQHFFHESNRARILILASSYVAKDHKIETKYLLSVDETFSKFEQPPHLQNMFTRLIGPLNGVYLVVSETWPLGPAGLLNPATRQFKPLPLLEHEDRSLCVLDFDFGLGLDPVTGDFKVVVIRFCMKFVAVCTSDNDYKSWMFLDGVKPRCRICYHAGANTYLNGVYYWLIYTLTDDVWVLAFDMSTEEFKEIRVMSFADQNVVPDEKWPCRVLALNGDSLVFIMKEQVSESIYVWTMLDEANWIRNRSSKMALPHDYDLDLVYFWKNDELLLDAEYDSGLVMNNCLITFNVLSQKVGVLLTAREIVELRTCHWYFIYKKSLVSLKGRLGNCILWDSSSDSIKDFFKRMSFS